MFDSLNSISKVLIKKTSCTYSRFETWDEGFLFSSQWFFFICAPKEKRKKNYFLRWILLLIAITWYEISCIYTNFPTRISRTIWAFWWNDGHSQIFWPCDGVMITFNVLWICSLSWISHHYAKQVMLWKLMLYISNYFITSSHRTFSLLWPLWSPNMNSVFPSVVQ